MVCVQLNVGAVMLIYDLKFIFHSWADHVSIIMTSVLTISETILKSILPVLMKWNENRE